MMAMILDRAGNGLRGELTRWLLEPRAGVFVGRVSARVRDKLWEKVCREIGSESGCLMVYATNNEQGFTIRTSGQTTRLIEDFEGLLLVRKR